MMHLRTTAFFLARLMVYLLYNVNRITFMEIGIAKWTIT
jgi:hypothetical protein